MYTYTSGLGKTPAVSQEEAKRAVQAIYQELFLRDPWNPYDAGAEGYVKCLTEGWCTTDFVRTEALKSDEYRDKELQRAQKVYGTAPGGALPSSGAPGYAAAPSDGGIFGMTVAGIPIVYLAGGVVLLMLLKKRSG